jgi:hypothetical protein
MLSSKHSWVDLISNSSSKSIKDESFDCDISEIPSLQTNNIDYTIIDSEIDPLHPKTHYSIGTKSDIKTKKPEPRKRKLNCSFI